MTGTITGNGMTGTGTETGMIETVTGTFDSWKQVTGTGPSSYGLSWTNMSMI
jgi:hypothetical protein